MIFHYTAIFFPIFYLRRITLKEKELTGYPSIDKPWLKYYSDEAINATLPKWGLFENIYENNKQHLHSIALMYWGNHISYQTLFDSIVGAKDLLSDLQISQGDIVSFVSVITPEMVYLFYACNMLGAVCNMIDPRLSATEKAEKIEKTNSRILIVLDACGDDLGSIVELAGCVQSIILLPVQKSMGFGIKVGYSLSNFFKTRSLKKSKTDNLIYWNQRFHKRPYCNEHSKANDSNAPAAIFYTGGTTGEAKGVLLSTYSINAIAEQFRGLTGGFHAGDTWLTLSVPFVAYAMICSLHLPLSLGMNCVIELYDVPKMAKSILKKKIKHISATPLLYAKLLDMIDTKEQDLSFLEMPISGGDKLNAVLYQKVNHLLNRNGCPWNVCSGYGMTEVSSAASVSHRGKSNKAGSSGIPFPNTIISAFDPKTNKECRIGQRGEIRISGPGVMLGYYGNTQKTADILWIDEKGNRWIRTGDLGYIDEDGCVFILERIKRLLIKYDGFKVFPSHVEEAALHSSYIENCCCVGKNDVINQCGELPVLFVTLKNAAERETAIADVQKHCNQELAEYSRPSIIQVIDSLPITHAGKVDYRALEQEAARME